MVVPLSPSDRLDILDLYARHAWSMDAGDVDAFSRCYLPDATLDDGRAMTVGRPALRGWLNRFLGDSAFPGSFHVYGQVHARAARGGARCRVAVARFHQVPGTTACQGIIQGAYDDRLARRMDRWWFAHKCMRSLEDLPGEPVATPRASVRHAADRLWHHGVPR